MEQYKKDYYNDVAKCCIILFNIILFFNFVTNTVILFKYILISFIFTFIACYIFYIFFNLKRNINVKVFMLIIVPFFYNSYFVINSFFSCNPKIEKYQFTRTLTDVGGRGTRKKGYSTTIILEKNAYSDYYFIRTFFDYEKMEYKTEIIYTFEDGLFGLRVLKDYKFSQSD